VPAPGLTANTATLVTTNASLAPIRAYVDSIRTGALSNTIAVEVVLASRLHLMVYGPGRTERVISCPLDKAYVGDQSHGDDFIKRELTGC
jgi:hypothetical protein